MADVTGKYEYRVVPERRAEVISWIESMETIFRRDGAGRIFEYVGSAAENGYLLDESVGGVFKPATAEIHLFYKEENNISYRAEELAHYVQYKEQGLIGKHEEEIGAEVINRNEDAMVKVMENHGFIRI